MKAEGERVRSEGAIFAFHLSPCTLGTKALNDRHKMWIGIDLHQSADYEWYDTHNLQLAYNAIPPRELRRANKRCGMTETELLSRITVNAAIFGGKPIIRGRRLAVEHVLGMLAAGDSPETILEGYAWMERADIVACLLYAQRVVGQERIEPALAELES